LARENEELRAAIINSYIEDNKTQNVSCNAENININQSNIPDIDNRKGYVYIATSSAYDQQSIYKLGRTSNLKNRLINYNTGRTSEDRIDYKYTIECYDAKTAESGLKSILNFCNLIKGTEMYRLSFDHLKEIVESYCSNLNRAITEFKKINENKISEYGGTPSNIETGSKSVQQKIY
jgi:hypothetical protein